MELAWVKLKSMSMVAKCCTMHLRDARAGSVQDYATQMWQMMVRTGGALGQAETCVAAVAVAEAVRVLLVYV